MPPPSIIAFLEAGGFEESIRNAISIGNSLANTPT
jgi:ADP-ribosylglycohydrolase